MRSKVESKRLSVRVFHRRFFFFVISTTRVGLAQRGALLPPNFYVMKSADEGVTVSSTRERLFHGTLRCLSGQGVTRKAGLSVVNSVLSNILFSSATGSYAVLKFRDEFG